MGKSCRLPSRRGLIVTLCVFPFWFSAGRAEAGIWDQLIRAGTRVADDVPIRQADELAEQMARSKVVREAVEDQVRAGLRRAGQADDGVAYARHLRRMLQDEAAALDPALLRRLEPLDTPAQEVALILQRGSRRLSDAVPDLAQRARLVQDGGPETVAALGMFGDELVDSALRLDAALRAGRVPSPRGMRAVQMGDFGQLFVKHGRAAERFWSEYVGPHWKAWLAGGALAWYLLDPEGFMDTAGRLTEEGFKRLTEALGEVLAIAIRGVGSGAKEAIGTSGEAILETYLSDWRGLAALAATLLLLGFVFARTRYYLLGPLRWLRRPPPQAKAPPPPHANAPSPPPDQKP